MAACDRAPILFPSRRLFTPPSLVLPLHCVCKRFAFELPVDCSALLFCACIYCPGFGRASGLRSEGSNRTATTLPRASFPPAERAAQTTDARRRRRRRPPPSPPPFHFSLTRPGAPRHTWQAGKPSSTLETVCRRSIDPAHTACAVASPIYIPAG